MKKPDVIQQVARDLARDARASRDRAAIDLRQANTLTALANRVRRMRGSRWRCVSKVKLQTGKYYVVRRVNGRKRHTPSVASWETYGWKERFGSIHPQTDSPTTIEVWC